MKKTKENVMRFALFVITALCLTSCGMMGPKIIPRAVNTVNTVSLSELNLERKDYRVLNTVTSEATITCEFKSGGLVEIKDETGEFELHYTNSNGVWLYNSHEGVMKLGYLAKDYPDTNGLLYPEEIARRAAIYRLINTVQQAGADGVIEPTVSTNIEQVNKKTIVYKSTVTGKVIKLKTDN